MKARLTIPFPQWSDFYDEHLARGKWHPAYIEEHLTSYSARKFGIITWHQSDESNIHITLDFISDDHMMNFALRYA